jgi:hypothetical protein
MTELVYDAIDRGFRNTFTTSGVDMSISTTQLFCTCRGCGMGVFLDALGQPPYHPECLPNRWLPSGAQASWRRGTWA